MGEVLIYSVALTSAQEQAVESYLQSKWVGTGSGASTLPAVYAAPGNILPTATPVTISSGGTLDLNNANLPITIGSLCSSDSTSRVLLGTGGTLTTGGDNTNTSFSGVISGSGQVVKTGSGSFTLAASNTYSGATTISRGTLQLGDGVSNNGSVAGNIINNARLTFANPNAQTYTGTISGSGGLTKTAAGVLILTGSNSYTGGTTVDGRHPRGLQRHQWLGHRQRQRDLERRHAGQRQRRGLDLRRHRCRLGLASEIAPGGIGSIGKLTIGSLLAASNLTTLNFDLTTPGGSGDLLVVTTA